MAEADGRRELAAKAFQEAADADLSDRARLMGRAAVSAAAVEDHRNAATLIEEAARAAATEGEAAFVAAVQAAVGHDAEDLSATRRSRRRGTPRLRTIALLLVGTVFTCRVRPEDVPPLIGALRAVSAHYDLEDPLVPCAKAVYEAVSDDHGAAKAAQFVGTLFSEMDDSDRLAVTEALLSG